VHGVPLPEAAYEYCTTVELAFSLASAVQKLGRAGLGDWLETLVFNAAQGARLPDGRALAYLSADTRLAATAARVDSYSMGQPSGRFKYSPTHDDVACCCNPNAVRLLPQFVSRMWMRLADEEGEGFAAVAYGPCELRAAAGGAAVTIAEATGYPFADTIEFTVTPERPVAFSLVLRRPAWTGSMDVVADGAEVVAREGWCRIRKTWRAGDRVRIAFDWRIRAEPYANGEAAVLRGPLQYALPVDHRFELTRRYAVPGLCDYDVLPRDPAQGWRVPLLDARAPDLGLAVEGSGPADPDHPWDAPGLALSAAGAAGARLVPLGATILRRAAFPVR